MNFGAKAKKVFEILSQQPVDKDHGLPHLLEAKQNIKESRKILLGEKIIESPVTIEPSSTISHEENSPKKSMLCVVVPHNQDSALKLRTQTQGVALGDKNETASVQHLLDQSCVTNEQ